MLHGLSLGLFTLLLPSQKKKTLARLEKNLAATWDKPAQLLALGQECESWEPAWPSTDPQ